jgi:hypothetical protein
MMLLASLVLAFGLQPSAEIPAAETVVRALYDAFNTGSADALVTHVSDDVKWMTVAGQSLAVEVAGKAALGSSMVRYFRSIPAVRSRIESIMSAGDFVTVHERVTWRAASGEKTQSALAVYKVRDRWIVSVWYYEVMP